MSGSRTERVLMSADSVGGVWNYALELSAQLARHDVAVILFVMGGRPSREQVQEAARLPNLTLIGTDLKREWMEGAARDLELAGELLLEMEADQRPDIVHLNHYWHADLPFRAPVLLAAHSCVPTWWRACRSGPLPERWRPYCERVAAGVAAVDMVVAPSHAHLAAFTATHGAPRHARVVWNGRDPVAWRGRDKRPVVLAAGRLWDEAKNVAVLCRAAERLDHPVLIAGPVEGPDGAVVERQPNVTWLGQLPPAELARHMGEAAVFAAPARYEPFGLGVLEAALSRCALVLGDIETLRELWDGAALFVPPEDPGQLLATLRALLADTSLLARLGQAARARARQCFSAARMGRSYLDIYDEMIGIRSDNNVGIRSRSGAAGRGAAV
jgi:glycogen synthase